MNEKRNLINQIKGFFLIEASWIKKYFTILLLAIIMGVICGLAMVGFNYLLILFKIAMQRFLPYFIAPIIAGLLTCLLVKFGHFDKIMGTGASEFVQEVNNPEMEFGNVRSLFAKTLATSWTYGSGMVCGLEGPGLLIGANLGWLISKIFHQDKIDYYFIGASACTGAILKAYCVLLLILMPFILDDYRSSFIGPDASFLNFFVNHVHDKRINWVFLLILLLLFAMAIFLSIGTMNSAGVIMPIIIFGAILGYIFGILFYPEHPELFVLVDISAVLGATLKTPIAAIFLIIEMTWCPFLFVPAAITTIIAYIFSGPSAIVSGQQSYNF